MSAKDRFIQDTLQTQGRKMLELQTAQLGKVLDSRTGNLLRARHIDVTGGRLIFTHPVYERYLDMKTRRPDGKTRKSRRIHNRYTFGTFQSIGKRLMYGFTADIAAEYQKLEEK